MGPWAYIAKVGRIAWGRSWSISQTVVTIAAVLVTSAWSQWPWLKLLFGDTPDVSNMWQFVALVLGAVFVMRLLCAPYWLHCDQERELEVRRTAEKLHDEKKAAKERRHWEKLNSEAKTRLTMEGRGHLARYVGKLPPGAKP